MTPPAAASSLTQYAALDGPVLLRDGSPAYLRAAAEGDRAGLVPLLRRHGQPVATRSVFARDPAHRIPNPLPEGHLPGSGPGKARVPARTLVVTRGSGAGETILGAGSLARTSPGRAEIAFVVRPSHREHGVGSLLLERLAYAAGEEGIRHLTLWVAPEQDTMRRVVRDSGFAVEERGESAGAREVVLDIEPTARSVEAIERRNRIATRASLAPFFTPRSVAVVGASREPGSVGHTLVTNLVSFGFRGPVFPVNPKADVVASIPAYASVAAIPRPVDLAVVCVPAAAVAAVAEDCHRKGVRAMVVLSAGFAETGAEGRRRQRDVLEAVRAAGMRMIGPNCLGVLNTHPDTRLNATFAPTRFRPGRVAMSSQSGALGLVILAFAQELGLGFSSFVSVGNKADVSGNDLLQYWEEDPQTDLILLYLESFGNPRRFSRIARRVARKKPILAVKSGRTRAGQAAASSHTAALASSEVASGALFRQAGVIRTDTMEEMFEVAGLLAHQPLPRGNRVGIVTNAGGLAILCADSCAAQRLELPPLQDATRNGLAAFLPPSASLRNPVDMIATADPESYRRAVGLLLDDPGIDAVIAMYVSAGLGTADEVAAAIREGRDGSRVAGEKPVVSCIMGHVGVERSEGSPAGADPATGGPAAGGPIPAYRFPESTARALGHAWRYHEWLHRPEGLVPDLADVSAEAARRICREALRTRPEGGWLLAGEIDAVLAAFRIPATGAALCRDPEEAVRQSREAGFPVAVKLASRTLVHKSEWGGVHLGLKDPAAVRRAWREIEDRLRTDGRADEMEGVTVQPMAPEGVETMVGVTQDPSFGPILAFGLGGVAVELLRDVSFRITPLTDRDAAEMLDDIKGHRLLDGYRGTPPCDREALVDLLLRVSRLAEEVPQIAEIDLNPVRALPRGQGIAVLDARILVREG